ncbi:MAG: hypothetical protein PHP50_05200 [Lachnospiraceae bacterium]|nr:hypothetical protein [Lachnospiraceae bacterium]
MKEKSILWIKKYWKPVLAVLEIVLIAVPFIVMLTSTPVDLTITGDYMNVVSGGESSKGGTIDEAMAEGKDDIAVVTEPITLKRGIYIMEVKYQEEHDGGVFSMSADKDEYGALRADTFMMRNDRFSEVMHFWLNYSVEDLKCKFEYAGQGGTMAIDSIRICTSKTTYSVMAFWIFLGCMVCNLILAMRKKFAESAFAEKAIPVLICMIALAASYELFAEGLVGQKDMDFHLYRIEGIKDGLLLGQFPVKIQPNWLNNYGYCNGVFYGDLFLYFPALLRLIGLPITTSYKLFQAAMNLLSAYIAYYSFSKITKDKWIGVIGSLIFNLAQYRLVDIYFRGAVGEYEAFTFMPLIVCGLYKILTDDPEEKGYGRNFLIAALGYSGLIQTHILSCEMAGIFTILTCILCVRRVFVKKRFIELVKVVLATIGLNFWFLVPFFDYFRDKFCVNDGSRDTFTIQYSGTGLQRVFHILFAGKDGMMEGSVGAALTIGFFLFIFLFLCSTKKQKKETTVKGMGQVFILAVLAIWMATNLFPYDFLKRFTLINKLIVGVQFPWRFFAVAVLLLTFVVCGMLAELKKHIKVEYYRMICAGFCVAAAFNGLQYQAVGDVSHFPESFYYDTIGIDSFCQVSGEYVPSGTDVAYLNRCYVYNLDGNVYVPDYTINGNIITAICQNDTANDGLITVPLLSYRGYVAKDMETGETFEVTKDENNCVQVVIPAGFHGTVEVRFHEFWYWRVAEILSLLYIATLIYRYGIEKKKH